MVNDACVFAMTYRDRLMAAVARLPVEEIAGLVAMVRHTVDAGREVFLCGNGGSAANASHIAGDLLKGALVEGGPRPRVVALTDNIPVLSAWANDTDYALVFAEQLRSYGQAGDLLIAISGSGNSQNVLNAVRVAKTMGMATAALLGRDGGEVGQLVDLSVIVASDWMEQIEDCHLAIGHIVAGALRGTAGGR